MAGALVSGADLRIVGKRCDKLVFGYRVALDPAFVAYLRERARVAREHGRAAFEWDVLLPTYKDARAPESGRFRKLGAMKPGKWADDARYTGQERRRVVWGELRYSRQENKWLITNEPFVIIAIDLHAPGGDVGPKSEVGEAPERANVAKKEAAPVLGKRNLFRPSVARALDERDARAGLAGGAEPGFTVEISVYADEIARSGLAAVERECEEIARSMGELFQKRLRRIDLCADVAGMTIAEDDLMCLVKRSRAAWVKNFADGTWQNARGERFYDEEWGVSDAHGKESGRATLVRASGPVRRVRARKFVPPMAYRAPKMTGLSVGRGGAMMMRIYDKREEMNRADDRAGEKREMEEEIWRAAGWDGEAPVSRVEFQIRGEALRDLGLRDPDCMQKIERDKDGNAIGHVEAIIKDRATGKMRKARLEDWLDRVWLTCIKWCRLIVPALTKSGKAVQVDRCALDPRWELLHTVRFTDRWAMPIKRYRVRGAASAMQSLGVALSQAAREGQLVERWDERKDWYAKETEPETVLLDRVRLLMRDVEARVVDTLVEKYGDAAGANAHLAIRANAKRARFARKDQQIEPRRPRLVGKDRTIASGVWTIPLDGTSFVAA